MPASHRKNNYGLTALNHTSKDTALAKVIQLLERENEIDKEESKEIIKAVIKAMPIAQQRLAIHIATKYGLKWSIIEELIK